MQDDEIPVHSARSLDSQPVVAALQQAGLTYVEVQKLKRDILAMEADVAREEHRATNGNYSYQSQQRFAAERISRAKALRDAAIRKAKGREEREFLDSLHHRRDDDRPLEESLVGATLAGAERTPHHSAKVTVFRDLGLLDEDEEEGDEDEVR